MCEQSKSTPSPQDLRTLTPIVISLDIGHSHDELALHVALAPCLFGYYEIGTRLFSDPETKLEGNPYHAWIRNYGDNPVYRNSVIKGREYLENKARGIGPDRLEKLVDIFLHATRMERGFWEMGVGRAEAHVV